MTNKPLLLAVSLFLAAAGAPTAAGAQDYGVALARPAPLYPYELQPGQPYAVEVAPNAFVIHRPPPAGDSPYVAPKPRQHAGKRAVIHTKKVVREPPVVIERRRVVDDPPRVVERYHYAEDAPPRVEVASPPRERVRRADLDLKQAVKAGEQRVIEADAVVTILGPDRMNIRLLRKRGAQARTH